MKTIFIVDDSDTNLSMAETALEAEYRVLTMPSAAKMFSFIKKVIPDMILLDIEMPEMDGFTALKKLKSTSATADIPVMFLTGHKETKIESLGFDTGVVDFITKPFSAPVLLSRIKTHLEIDRKIQEKAMQIRKIQDNIVSVLSELVETRDKGTGGHIERTSEYIRILINEMKEQGLYAEEISGWNVEKMIASACMHDLGKICITDLIVNKPSKLTSDEYNEVKKHATEGERIIDEIISRTGDNEFLNNAKLFAGSHHERWDGKGYPRGLKGEEIPVHGRVMAIVDVYDALVSERPYKKAFTDEEAMRIIQEQSGCNFDPKIVEITLKVKDKLSAVRMKRGGGGGIKEVCCE